MMRKILLIFIVMVALLTTFGCGGSEQKSTVNSNATSVNTQNSSDAVVAERAMPVISPTIDTSENQSSPINGNTNKTSEKEPIKDIQLIAVTAKVNGTHYIGDTLSGEDFIITATFSDGSTVTNPEGWGADPLYLSGETNNINVIYGGIATTVTVNAIPKSTTTNNPPKYNRVDETYNFDKYNNVDQQNTTDSYVLNIKSKKIHRPSCKDVPKIKPENYSTTNKSLEELELEGYTTCGHCF